MDYSHQCHIIPQVEKSLSDKVKDLEQLVKYRNTSIENLNNWLITKNDKIFSLKKDLSDQIKNLGEKNDVITSLKKDLIALTDQNKRQCVTIEEQRMGGKIPWPQSFEMISVRQWNQQLQFLLIHTYGTVEDLKKANKAQQVTIDTLTESLDDATSDLLDAKMDLEYIREMTKDIKDCLDESIIGPNPQPSISK